MVRSAALRAPLPRGDPTLRRGLPIAAVSPAQRRRRPAGLARSLRFAENAQSQSAAPGPVRRPSAATRQAPRQGIGRNRTGRRLPPPPRRRAIAVASPPNPRFDRPSPRTRLIARSRLKTAIKPRRVGPRAIGVGQQTLFFRRRRRQRPSRTFPGGQAPQFPIAAGGPLMPIRADDAGPRLARTRLPLAPASQQGDDPGQRGDLSQTLDVVVRELARPAPGL